MQEELTCRSPLCVRLVDLKYASLVCLLKPLSLRFLGVLPDALRPQAAAKNLSQQDARASLSK